jgi:membrane dipeptidase
MIIIAVQMIICIMKHLILILLLTTAFPGLAQKFKKVHKKAIVIDTHNDVLSDGIMKGLHLEDDLTGKAHSDLRRFKSGGVDAQVFSVFCDSTYGKGAAFKFANAQIDSLYAIAARNPDKMVIVQSPQELFRAVKQKKLAAMIGVEGGHMIEDNVSFLDSLYNRGARYLTITWNNSTSWATSSLDESSNPVKNNKKGLNEFGRRVVKRMNELGMMIDVSHGGEQTFWDVIHTTTKPVIASHSGAYSLKPIHRNLKDEQIKAIAKNKGVIQIYFSSTFLDTALKKQAQLFFAKHGSEMDSLFKENDKPIALWFQNKYPEEYKGLRTPLSTVLDHIDYIVRLVGVDYVGLGSDFDGILFPPIGLDDVSQFPNLTKGLLERGYSKTDINKILGGNFIRVFKANSE